MISCSLPKVFSNHLGGVGGRVAAYLRLSLPRSVPTVFPVGLRARPLSIGVRRIICRRQRLGGTEGSNPVSSRGESANHRFGTAPPIVLGRRKWDREFESGLLQRRVNCEPDFRGRIPTPLPANGKSARPRPILTCLARGREDGTDSSNRFPPAESLLRT